MSGHMQSPITDHHPQRVAMRKNTRWAAVLGVIGALTLLAVYSSSQAAEPGPALKKKGTTAPISGGAQPGGTTAPAGRVVPPPTGPQPMTVSPGPTYVGPTPDLTAVANAISCSHKSLTITCTVKPGLTLTKPVTISIGFINSAAVPKLATQCYGPSTGNRFVFNDIEWRGQPRRVAMNFTVSQDKLRPGDRGYSFTVPWHLDLDPLYDIAVSRLGFYLIDDCDVAGDSEIHFGWFPPDSSKSREDSFHTSKRKNTFIDQFAWARTEVSAFERLHFPNHWFTEYDPYPPLAACAYLGPTPSTEPLIPGVTREHNETLKASDCQSCRAALNYKITHLLRRYAEDSPVGAGCIPSVMQSPVVPGQPPAKQ